MPDLIALVPGPLRAEGPTRTPARPLVLVLGAASRCQISDLKFQITDLSGVREGEVGSRNSDLFRPADFGVRTYFGSRISELGFN